MGKRADELSHSACRQGGVRIESDDEANIAGYFARADMSMECSTIAFDEHVIELLKLSALALPCEPAPLCFTILSRAHQQVKRLASLAAIASVERENLPF